MSAPAEQYTIPGEECLEFRDTIRQLAQERIAPRAAEIDEQAEYLNDLRNSVERMLRDAKITQTYKGSSEIQRLAVARMLS